MKLIMDSFFEESGYIKNLKSKLEKSGFDVYVLEYIPFVSEDLKIPDNFKSGEHSVFVYGTIQFVKKITKKYNHVVAFFSNKDFDVSNYLSKALYRSDLFLNGDSFLIGFGMLKSYPEKYFNLIGEDKIFIRPNSGNKVFTGFILSKDNIEEQVEHMEKFTSVVDTTMIVVSKVKDIKREYRTIIVGNSVVAASMYMEDDEFKMSETIPERVYETASKYARLSIEQKVDDYVVCDIAELTNGDFEIIELNALSTSDLYMCDPNALKIAVDHYLKSLN